MVNFFPLRVAFFNINFILENQINGQKEIDQALSLLTFTCCISKHLFRGCNITPL